MIFGIMKQLPQQAFNGGRVGEPVGYLATRKAANARAKELNRKAISYYYRVLQVSAKPVKGPCL